MTVQFIILRASVFLELSGQHVSVINMPWQIFVVVRSWKKFQRDVHLFLEILRSLFIVQNRKKEAPVPKINSIRSVVSIELRLLTDRQIQGHFSTHASIASCA